MSQSRALTLTPEHVAHVVANSGELNLAPLPPDRRFATDEDYERICNEIMADVTGGEFWVFAYGSLIWKPAFEFVERRRAKAYGWHRSFCLGWDERFRGSVNAPGLMLALDQGGCCTGLAYRLPPGRLEQNVQTLIRREIQILPHPFPPRRIRLMGQGLPETALSFVMDRRSQLYVDGLSPEQIADKLACAVGHLGSMAEYLYNTVVHLEELGIHDRSLWHLQKLVARRIDIDIARTA